MAFPLHIFGSNDIRGLLADVTPNLARQVGAALVVKTGAKNVVVGRDMRSTSPALALAAMEGITRAGADVYDIGLCTTSMYNFAVSSSPQMGAGLMVTASHNPPQYNGIKMALSSGLPVSGKEILPLLKEEFAFPSPSGRVHAMNVLPLYLDACISRSDLPDLSALKVVVDYGNGMGVVSVRPLLERLGVRAIELFPELDPTFPNHEANPAKEETLVAVKEAVRREGADLGVALDGDADRVAFIDNEGESLRGDLTLALLARDWLSSHVGAKIVTSPNQSWTTTDTIREAGGKIISVPTGRKYVIEAMYERGADLGGELTSHYMFQEFGNLEAVDYAMSRVLGIWQRSGMSFADLVRPLRRFFNSWEVNLEVQDTMNALQRIEARYAPEASVVNKLDGIRCEFDRDWWFIARPSNTEPLLRITVEATRRELMEEKRDELVAFVSR
jgi:phosphomannomutase